MPSCLVVDDSDVIRKVARHILEGLDSREMDSSLPVLHGNVHHGRYADDGRE